MKYGEAAKKYFQAKGQPVSFPKKDSEDYKGIMSLMRESGAAAMAAGDATANSAVSAQAAPLEKKVKRAYKKKEKAAPAPGPSQDTPTKAGGSTTLVDQPHVTAQAVSAVVPDAEKEPKKKRAPRAVKSDGETPQMNLLKANADENASMHIAPADYPGLKGQIEKVLEVKPEGIPETKKKEFKAEMMVSKTTEGKRTDDPKAVMARAPFSFQAVRHLLRQ